MKKAVFLLALALCLMTGISAEARSPKLNPHGTHGPSYTSFSMFYFRTTSAPTLSAELSDKAIVPSVYVKQTVKYATVVFNQAYGNVTVTVKNAAGAVVGRRTVDTDNVPFLSIAFAEEGWKPGVYTLSVDGVYNCVLTVGK